MRYCDCGNVLPLQVCSSAAGYYIGRVCQECGPWSRESQEYYPTYEEAEEAMYKKNYTKKTWL